jgi:hypothetical protein
MHALGIAIDINPNQLRYWLQNKTKNDDEEQIIPQTIIDIFEKHGFIWGGKWRHYDAMHFEYRPELF